MANQQQTQRQHEQTNPSQVAATATQYDQQAYKEALRRTSAQTFAQTAASMAASPAMGPLQNPNLIHLILADHANVNTLFSHFFQAAEAGASNIQGMVLGALVLAMRLHSQAEMQVLYPILSQRLGPNGAVLAKRCLTEHAMVEQSLEDCLRLRAGPAGDLLDRVKQMQTEFITHQGEEEQLVLPQIAAACTGDELAQLALAFKAVKQTAPLMPQVAATNSAAAMIGASVSGATTEASPSKPAAEAEDNMRAVAAEG